MASIIYLVEVVVQDYCTQTIIPPGGVQVVKRVNNGVLGGKDVGW